MSSLCQLVQQACARNLGGFGRGRRRGGGVFGRFVAGAVSPQASVLRCQLLDSSEQPRAVTLQLLHAKLEGLEVVFFALARLLCRRAVLFTPALLLMADVE